MQFDSNLINLGGSSSDVDNTVRIYPEEMFDMGDASTTRIYQVCKAILYYRTYSII